MNNSENFNLTGSKIINSAYERFFEKHGYLPEFFNAYNCSEIRDIAPTITAACAGITTSGCVLVMERVSRTQTRCRIGEMFFDSSEPRSRSE